MNLENNTSSFSEKEQEDLPLVPSLLILIFLISVSALLGLGLIRLVGMAFDFDFTDLISGLSDNSSSTERDFFRLMILINHLTMFVLPGIIFSVFIYKKNWLSFLKLNVWPNIVNVLGGIVLLLLSMPFVQFLFWFNQNKIPLPDWARTMETSTADTINSMLIADVPYEFFFNVLVVALIPSIGEELIFRGILQKRFEKSFRNTLIGIWLSAFIFSAFHMQFEGFFPRFVLGALLGYLYYWSGNLWVPIIAHFMNNFLQILVQYFHQKELTELDIENLEMIPLWQWLPSLVLVLTVGYFLQQYNRDLQKEKYNNTNTIL